MKSILILTDQFTIGGLETHISGEIAFFSAQGYSVHLLVAGAIDFKLIPPSISSVTVVDPISVSLDSESFVNKVEEIRKVIREKNVTIIHCHPFLSLICGSIAAELEGIPYFVTLHGPSSLDSYGNFYDGLLKNVVLKYANLVICVSQEIAEQVVAYTPTEQILVQHNSVSFDLDVSSSIKCDILDPRWIIVSRLDQFKVPGIISAIKDLSAAGVEGFVIAGDGDAMEVLKSSIAEIGLDGSVTFLGVVADVTDHLGRYSGVGGMGRVVLESIACRRPTVLIGYDGIKGVIDADLFRASITKNFSGRGLPNITPVTLQTQLEQMRQDPSIIDDVFRIARKSCDVNENWRYVEEISATWKSNKTSSSTIYQEMFDQVLVETRPIFDSSLLLNELNKLLDIETEAHFEKLWDRIGGMNSELRGRLEASYDAKDRRILELEFDLMNRTIGNRTLFREVAEVSNKIEELSSLLVLRDQNIQSQTDELNRSIQHLDRQITYGNSRIESSIKNFLSEAQQRSNNIKDYKNESSRSFFQSLYIILARSMKSLYSSSERYHLIRDLYWKLPYPIRNRLQWFRGMAVRRRLKSGLNYQVLRGEESSPNSSWTDWLSGFDKVAIVTCGFEFDELVNQRPINLAKYLSSAGYGVIFVAWQWSPDEPLQKGCSLVYDNVYQVPLFDFINGESAIPARKSEAHYIVAMPAKTLFSQVSFLRKKGFDIIYDIMDEWEEFHKVGQAPWYDEYVESALVLNSDKVFVVAPSLREKFSYLRTDIALSPNGFTPATIGLDARNIVESNSENKVIGYFGHLTDSWFDWPLVFELALVSPDVEFQIIGYGAPEWVERKAHKLPNVKLLGKVHPSQLKEYVINWTHGLIPFREGKLSRAVDPIKIYEYLYFGLPTLVTGIEHLDSYPNTKWCSREEIVDNFPQFLDAASERGATLDSFLSDSVWTARFHSMISETTGKKTFGDLYV